MADAETYSAQLVNGDSTESVELELIGGLPQKSFVREGTDGGAEVVWELDPDADEPTYRPADSEGYGER
ncbi:hypothetical protein BH09ACT1_BH09ACT1_15500 [soil metagenome]